MWPKIWLSFGNCSIALVSLAIFSSYIFRHNLSILEFSFHSEEELFASFSFINNLKNCYLTNQYNHVNIDKLGSFQMPESLIVNSYSAMAEAEPDLSTFENKSGLAEDMKFLASMPELCDVTFLVGDTREPVCAVKAVLAARSRVFHKMLYQVINNLDFSRI